MRAVYRETNFGPQLDIRKIREVNDADAADGFEPTMFLPRSRFDPAEMFAELVSIARTHIADAELRALVVAIMEANRTQLLELPAATRNHHCYVGGYLEHVLSVTRTALYLAEKYDDYYPDLQPRLESRRARGRSDPARHRQASRDRLAAGGSGLPAGRRSGRPYPARARHRPRSSGRTEARSRNCCCGWST